MSTKMSISLIVSTILTNVEVNLPFLKYMRVKKKKCNLMYDFRHISQLLICSTNTRLSENNAPGCDDKALTTGTYLTHPLA